MNKWGTGTHLVFDKQRFIRLTRAAKAGKGKKGAEDRASSISLVEIKAAGISHEDAEFMVEKYRQFARSKDEWGGEAAEPRALLFERIIELLQSPAVTDN